MEEGDVRELLRLDEDVRIEVAERRRKEQLRPVEADHALHRLLDGVGLGDVLFLADLDAGELGDDERALVVRLVVAVVVLRPDVDEADRQRLVRGVGPALPAGVGAALSWALAPDGPGDGQGSQNKLR